MTHKMAHVYITENVERKMRALKTLERARKALTRTNDYMLNTSLATRDAEKILQSEVVELADCIAFLLSAQHIGDGGWWDEEKGPGLE